MFHGFTQHVPAVVVDLVRLCAWLTILAAIFVPLERLFALHPSKIWRKGIGADIGYYFLGGLVVALLLSFPLGALAWAAHEIVPDAVRNTFGGLPFWARAGLGLVLGEIGYYWGHRLMHETPLLWRFHAIHHSPDHIDFLVNSRAHPVDLVFGRLCAFVPLVVLGLAQPSGPGAVIPALITVIGLVWAFFIHANVRWRLGPLEWLISTPGFHHWHHAMEPANRNYASILPVLDRIFGSLHLPKGQWPPRYGISGTVPVSWTEQLVQPLLGSFPLADEAPLPPMERPGALRRPSA
jgi:sterol desaturase/sphingolipid hydroxylase (fatty acid hydroxylase superfamily)